MALLFRLFCCSLALASGAGPSKAIISDLDGLCNFKSFFSRLLNTLRIVATELSWVPARWCEHAVCTSNTPGSDLSTGADDVDLQRRDAFHSCMSEEEGGMAQLTGRIVQLSCDVYVQMVARNSRRGSDQSLLRQQRHKPCMQIFL